uniref:Homeobox-leucine zipper protein n=1 Tax=Ananas comosus var. bracteatus TaxID=296719 RepID=A0A6V7QMR3_ANACO|nr:unnamed protein product [Ananas comosus var. bracteatus]
MAHSGELFLGEAAGVADPFASMNGFAGKRGRRGEFTKKRRFSEQQVRSLETTFEVQAKLEPKKKAQLALDLGLQPRQVAIWFQNKRARWKSKQLEHEFAALRADHDALFAAVEALRREKQILLRQLQKLKELLEKQTEENEKDGGSSNGGDRAIAASREGSANENVLNSEHGEIKLSCVAQAEDAELLYLGEPEVSGCLTSIGEQQQQQCGFNCSSSPENCTTTTTTSEWWEFWPLTELNPVA